MDNRIVVRRISFVELARITECALEDLVLIAHSARLPFISIAGRYWIEPQDMGAWRTRTKQLLGDD
jgi:hypothetical protein